MDVQWTVVCHPGGNTLRHRISETFTYHSDSDTLTDSVGLVFHRAS